jgi:hypothetical protein
LCLAHDEDLQEISWFWNNANGTSKHAVWRVSLCAICTLMSVAGGTHGWT